jgi:hypothetical protein
MNVARHIRGQEGYQIRCILGLSHTSQGYRISVLVEQVLRQVVWPYS